MNEQDRPALDRHEEYTCADVADVDVRLANGRIEVRATDEPGARVTVSALGPSSDDESARAVDQTTVAWAEESGRLTVQTPRRSTLAVVVEVPSGSRVSARAGSAAVTVNGTVARLDAHTGSGNVSATRVEGGAEIRTGSGDVQLGSVAGRVRLRAGSGRIEAAVLDGPDARLTTGNGDILLGTVRSDVTARTGRGNVRVEDAARGRLDLTTGSGDVWIGIHPGVAAEVDALSGSGLARSELDLSDAPPAGAPALRLRARTGSGSAVVARAAA